MSKLKDNLTFLYQIKVLLYFKVTQMKRSGGTCISWVAKLLLTSAKGSELAIGRYIFAAQSYPRPAPVWVLARKASHWPQFPHLWNAEILATSKAVVRIQRGNIHENTLVQHEALSKKVMNLYSFSVPVIMCPVDYPSTCAIQQE